MECNFRQDVVANKEQHVITNSDLSEEKMVNTVQSHPKRGRDVRREIIGRRTHICYHILFTEY